MNGLMKIMSFNYDKFEHLSISKHGPSAKYLDASGKEIVNKDAVKDLGITISNEGNFKKHISNIAVNGRKLTGWLLRTFKTRNITVMLTLLKQILLPKLEYCSPIWYPIEQEQIKELENIQ